MSATPRSLGGSADGMKGVDGSGVRLHASGEEGGSIFEDVQMAIASADLLVCRSAV